MQLTGFTAIEFAAANGLTVAKYADPTEGARDGLTVSEAREIAAEDPGLIWIEAPDPVGYVVSATGKPPAFVRTLEAARKRGQGWDRAARRIYGKRAGLDFHMAAVYADGRIEAGGDRATGINGMGIGGEIAVQVAKTWLNAKPAVWRKRHGIA